jgi:hypothetical protein
MTVLMTTPEAPEARIPRAARWLDETYPGWAEKIDLDYFNMAESSRCIGHYLGVDWWNGLSVRFQRETEVSSAEVFSGNSSVWRREVLARTEETV